MTFGTVAANAFSDAQGDNSASWSTWNANVDKVTVASTKKTTGYSVTVTYNSLQMKKNASSNESQKNLYGKATWAATTTSFTSGSEGVKVVYGEEEYDLLGENGFFFGRESATATEGNTYHDWYILKGGVDGSATEEGKGKFYNRNGKSLTLTFKQDGYDDTTVVWNFVDKAVEPVVVLTAKTDFNL